MTINSDKKWYEVIWYVHKLKIYFHTYPSTYEVRAHMILPKHISIQIRDDNDELIYLTSVSYSIRHIFHKRNDNVSGF